MYIDKKCKEYLNVVRKINPTWFLSIYKITEILKSSQKNADFIYFNLCKKLEACVFKEIFISFDSALIQELEKEKLISIV